ncbi:MAG: hypothetical protein Q4Q51_03660 [Eubacteriales bacterium]|nr:hypothetical protein [Eubacteriales bacterium]
MKDKTTAEKVRVCMREAGISAARLACELQEKTDLCEETDKSIAHIINQAIRAARYYPALAEILHTDPGYLADWYPESPYRQDERVESTLCEVFGFTPYTAQKIRAAAKQRKPMLVRNSGMLRDYLADVYGVCDTDELPDPNVVLTFVVTVPEGGVSIG